MLQYKKTICKDLAMGYNKFASDECIKNYKKLIQKVKDTKDIKH